MILEVSNNGCFLVQLVLHSLLGLVFQIYFNNRLVCLPSPFSIEAVLEGLLLDISSLVIYLSKSYPVVRDGARLVALPVNLKQCSTVAWMNRGELHLIV